MKTIKIITAILLLTITSSSFSQIRATRKIDRSIVRPGEGKGGESLSNIPSCFCCEEAFNLPKVVEIIGLGSICTGNSLTYTVENCKGATINWTVTPTVTGLTGSTTNTITLPATTPAGTYVVNVKISCGKYTTTGSRTVTICAKQNPAFSTTTTATSVTFTSTAPCTNLWYFFEDKNNNCLHDVATENSVQGQSGATSTFSNLVVNKQYVVHHYVQCACGNGAVCQSFQAFCFRWLPSQMKTTDGNSGGRFEVISDKEITDLKEVPAEILQKIEQDKK